MNREPESADPTVAQSSGIDLDSLSIDQLEQLLLEAEHRSGQLRTLQAETLARLDTSQIALRDGYRTFESWVAARLDVSHSTARDLVSVCRSQSLAQIAADPSTSFDRSVVTIELITSGAPTADIARSRGLDIDGARRLIQQRANQLRDLSDAEIRDARFLFMQPTLDGRRCSMRGSMPGITAEVIERAITDRADEFGRLPNGVRPDRSQRMVDGLESICLDAIDGASGQSLPQQIQPGNPTTDRSASVHPISRPEPPHRSSTPLISVIVNAMDLEHPMATTARGVSVGASVLDELFCAGQFESITAATNLTPVAVGRKHRRIKPSLKRAVLHRDNHSCTIEGCPSTYRLEPHHIIEAHDRIETTPENLTTLCWYHHHVVVHRYGFEFDPNTPAQRRRFKRKPA